MPKRSVYLAFVVFLILLLDRVLGQSGLSKLDEQEILDSHNYFRGLVTPTASNMERMVSIQTLSLQTLPKNFKDSHGNINRL